MYMGVSTRNHQVHTENFFEFDETFTSGRALLPDHFGKKSLTFVPFFHLKLAKYFSLFLSLFRKNASFPYRKLEISLRKLIQI
jgi:hypothetical protein